MDEAQSIRFYFSFRSPYAWIAAERLEAELGPHAARIELVAMYPTDATFPNDPTRVPNKLRYIAKDIARLSRQYGLPLRGPSAIDTDWGKAHAAFCGAEAQGGGPAFMLEMFRARWCRGLDVGETQTIADVAARCDLDPDAVLRASTDPQLLTRVQESFRLGQEQDGIFGVPSFVYNGALYWGHDRMAMLRGAIERDARPAVA